MKKIFIKLVSFLFMIGALSSSAIAIDKLHFVVPGGAGGGWDGCARGTGAVSYTHLTLPTIYSV